MSSPIVCAAARTRCRSLRPCSPIDVAVVLEHGEAEAVDGAQRRAQVVGDGVDELLQLLVGRGELARALGDAPLEVGVERAGSPPRRA